MKKTLIFSLLITISYTLNAQILLTTSHGAELRTKPSFDSEVITSIEEHRNIEVIETITRDFFKIKIDELIGYLYKSEVLYCDNYYVALLASDKSIRTVYLEKKNKIDKTNKIKISEEKLWFRNVDKIVYKGGQNKQITKFPLLEITDIVFLDHSGNKIIDANEECSLNFTIFNKGEGIAENIVINIKDINSITGLDYVKTQKVSRINSNSASNVIIPLKGSFDLGEGKAKIEVSFSEKYGFAPDNFDINIATKKYIKPDIKIVDYSFLTDGKKIKLGRPIQFKILVQNIGQGKAENVNVKFSFPNNVFPNGNSEFYFDELDAGNSKEIIFEFIANKLYKEKNIPITAIITEKYKRFGNSKTTHAQLNDFSSGKIIDIKGIESEQKKIDIKLASLTSDVDINIPVISNKNVHRYALIFGNEDYNKYQTDLGSEANVLYARNDAGIFAKYCENTLGVPKENIVLLKDAISSQMLKEIEKLSKLAFYSKGQAEIIFYYAGHGFPDERTKESYLMPVDISGADVTMGIKLNDLYQKLTENPTKKVTIFLDACFSGGGREQGLLAARAVKVKPRENTVKGNMVVFSASTGDQSSLPYKEKQHGMFTYFLLKKLQETSGNVTYEELGNYIKDNVQLNSIKINSKDQNPQILISPNIKEQWKNWIFN